MKNKKNLMIIVPNLGIGGQERVAVNTADILADRYNIVLVVFTLEAAIYQTHCQVVDLQIPAATGYLNKISNVCKRVRALKQLKRKFKTDVAISLGTTANIANALSRVADKIILSVHSYLLIAGARPLYEKTIDRLIYRRADTIICVAEKIARDLVALYGVPPDRVVTLYNPYDFDTIAEQAQVPIPLEIRHPAIVTMGRLVKVKGYPHLLRVLARVQPEVPGTTLVFVGEGEEQPALERMAAELGLAGQVLFAGFQSNPYSYLAKGDVYALSSINEGFPNGLIEAMACALPVVSSDCKSGPREIITETHEDRVAVGVEFADYGILVPPFAADDSDEPELDRLYAEAIVRLLTEEQLYRHYKHQAQERAKAFSFEVYKNKIIPIIEG